VTEALKQLSEHVSEVSEVIFFLLGAMTIVEIVDAHQGFKVVTDSIKVRNMTHLVSTCAQHETNERPHVCKQHVLMHTRK
jgi:hypothetical protein